MADCPLLFFFFSSLALAMVKGFTTFCEHRKFVEQTKEKQRKTKAISRNTTGNMRGTELTNFRFEIPFSNRFFEKQNLDSERIRIWGVSK